MRRLLTAGDRVPEEFDAAWRPIESAGAAPGHQFEWAWLLERLRLSGGGDRSATAHALVRFGERHGVDADGFAVDAIDLDGMPRSATARLWPQAERLKAALAGLGPEPLGRLLKRPGRSAPTLAPRWLERGATCGRRTAASRPGLRPPPAAITSSGAAEALLQAGAARD